MDGDPHMDISLRVLEHDQKVRQGKNLCMIKKKKGGPYKPNVCADINTSDVVVVMEENTLLSQAW